MDTSTQHAVISSGTQVNDIHSQLNATSVHRIVRPDTVAAIQDAIRAARAEDRAVSIAGGCHAMGGQQFGEGTVLLDMNGMDRVIDLDRESGQVTVGAGIQWPDLVAWLVSEQDGEPEQWGIAQKQTGADRLSIGGALSANVHGRGLARKPIIDDVERFTIVDGSGELRTCSRTENADLFRLAIGGYGLFGVIATVTLRLVRRRKVERVVAMGDIESIMDEFDARIAAGFLYGDFQFAIDPAGDDFLKGGIFSCYLPVPNHTPIPEGQPALSREAWGQLLLYAHTDKRAGVDAYTAHYLTTNGAIAWSDLHQMTDYTDNYHAALDQYLGATEKATEMITEIYVPRAHLAQFMADVRDDFRANDVDLIYGTVRLIERDDESFLAWARERWACIIFNLHTVHTAEGLAHSASAFRRLIDHAIRYGGSYYLTYHRWATREQVEACYPQFAEFLREKRRHDPDERFQSEWYRHYRQRFGDGLADRLALPAQWGLPFRIDEPDVSLTDFGLALETAIFAVILARRHTSWTRLRSWGVAFFGAATTASIAGAIDHGFLRRDGRDGIHDAFWVATLVAIGASSLALVGIGAELGLSRSAARRLVTVASAVLTVYAFGVIVAWREFLVAILAYAPAALLLLVIFTRRWIETRERASLFGIAAVVLAFGAAAIQRLEVGVDALSLGHNALYHVVQAASFALLFAALRDLLGERRATGETLTRASPS